MDQFFAETIIKSNPKSCVLLKPKDFLCHNGWFHLINEMCSLAELCLKENDRLKMKFLYFKEKFGVLDTGFLGGDETTKTIISFAEVLSYKTCEECGAFGHLQSSSSNAFANFKTLCLKDGIKQGFIKV